MNRKLRYSPDGGTTWQDAPPRVLFAYFDTDDGPLESDQSEREYLELCLTNQGLSLTVTGEDSCDVKAETQLDVHALQDLAETTPGTSTATPRRHRTT